MCVCNGCIEGRRSAERILGARVHLDAANVRLVSEHTALPLSHSHACPPCTLHAHTHAHTHHHHYHSLPCTCSWPSTQDVLVGATFAPPQPKAAAQQGQLGQQQQQQEQVAVEGEGEEKAGRRASVCAQNGKHQEQQQQGASSPGPKHKWETPEERRETRACAHLVSETRVRAGMRVPLQPLFEAALPKGAPLLRCCCCCCRLLVICIVCACV